MRMQDDNERSVNAASLGCEASAATRAPAKQRQTPSAPRTAADSKALRSKRIDFRATKLGLGRIQISSGTASQVEYKRRKALVKQLINSQDLDILRALRDDRLTIEELVEAHGSKSMDALRRRVTSDNPPLASVRYQEPAPVRLEAPRQVVGERVTTLRTWDDVAKAAEDILSQRLWSVLEGDATWDDSTAGTRTKTRYGQALRALRVRLALARLSNDGLQRLAELPARVWKALDQAHRRGLAVAEAKAVTDSAVTPRKHKAKKRRKNPPRAYSMANRTAAAPEPEPTLRKLRLGRDAILGLRLLDHDAWRILMACDGLLPSQTMVRGIVQLEPNMRGKLRELALLLHPDALTVSLEESRAVHWAALSAAWNTSSTDWNHMRRAISAALTSAFGYEEHELRLRLMRRLELRHEFERVTDLDFETFERILSFLPERYRPHFRTLLQTGLRLSEFVRLTPAHLHPESRLVNVPGTKTPFSANYIKVDPDFWPDLLASVPCPISGNGLHQVWRKACEAAGVVGARQHDLRHAFGQWSLEEDVQDHEVQHALRQTSGNMTARYRRLKHSEAASAGLARALRAKRVELASGASRSAEPQADAEHADACA